MSVAWYALHVRSQFERKVRDALDRERIEPYLPLYTVRKRWSDRSKDAECTLFPGYVFGHFDLDQRRKVLALTGVVRILGIGIQPEAIDTYDIDQVRRVVDSQLAISPIPSLVRGQRVRVEAGALAGLEGIILRNRNPLRIVVSVNMLNRSVAAELDTDAVSVLPMPALKMAA